MYLYTLYFIFIIENVYMHNFSQELKKNEYMSFDNCMHV